MSQNFSFFEEFAHENFHIKRSTFFLSYQHYRERHYWNLSHVQMKTQKAQQSRASYLEATQALATVAQRVKLHNLPQTTQVEEDLVWSRSTDLH